MDKGARIRIIYGEGKDQTGTVFWTGPNKFGGGERLGVSGDDGQTWWVNSDAVEPLGEEDPATKAPTFSKGDRVTWGSGDHAGTVFWVGDSRRGPGQRLGVNDDHGEEAVWLDGHQARPLEHEPPPPSAAPPEPTPYDDGPSLEAPPWEGPPDMPAFEEPPADDGWYDTLAASGPEDDEGPPPDLW